MNGRMCRWGIGPQIAAAALMYAPGLTHNLRPTSIVAVLREEGVASAASH